MKVLVTGYSGNLGRPTARALAARGHQVRGLLHSRAIDKRDRDAGVDIVWGDLRDPDRFDDYVDGCDVVVHCAWNFNRNPVEQYHELNIENAVRLLETAAKSGAHTFVEVSSVAVYGLDTPSDRVVDEAFPFVDPERALDSYPSAKAELEGLLAQRADELGMRLVIVRPGLLYSDRNAPVKRVVAGLGLIVGRGRNQLPFVHTDDVADFIATVVDAADAQGAYNVVGTTDRTAAAFAQAWQREHESPLRIVRVPVPLFKLLVLAPWLVKTVLRKQATRPDPTYPTATGTRNCRYSAERALALGWIDRHTRRTASGGSR
ncbi:MAG: NAD-dependent epimerase/dehydratase family protein [Acidimicrobiia bacterium]